MSRPTSGKVDLRVTVIPMFGDEQQGSPKDGDKPIPYRELYPIKEAAVLLGVSLTKAYRMADSGLLPTRWLEGNRQVPRDDLFALIKNLPAGETRKRIPRQPQTDLVSP